MSTSIIKATLLNETTASALGCFKIHSPKPVEALCRLLLNIGHHPKTIVDVFDGDRVMLRSVRLGDVGSRCHDPWR